MGKFIYIIKNSFFKEESIKSLQGSFITHTNIIKTKYIFIKSFWFFWQNKVRYRIITLLVISSLFYSNFQLKKQFILFALYILQLNIMNSQISTVYDTNHDLEKVSKINLWSLSNYYIR